MSNMKQKAEKSKPRTRTATNTKKTVIVSKTTKRKIAQLPAKDKPVDPIGNGVDAKISKRTKPIPKVEKKETVKKVHQENGEKKLKSTRKRKSDDDEEEEGEVPDTAAEEVLPARNQNNDIGRKPNVKRKKVSLEVPGLPTASGVLFVVGVNDVGQLGFGEEVEFKKRPAELSFPSRFVDIAAGGMHSVCLTAAGDVYTFGCNDEGALGRVTEDEEAERIPRKVDIPAIVVKISAGDSHSAALTEDGHVYIWGNFRSNEGPMGLTAHGVKQITPIRILADVTIVSIASGNEHLVCLSNEGFLYTCGSAEAGQLGRVTERSAKDGGRKGKTVLLEPRLVLLSVSGRPIPVDMIWAGSYSTFARATGTGLVYGFGLNNHNQLGFEDQLTGFFPTQVPSFNSKSWQIISGGQHHTLALDSKGQAYSLGRKEYGRLGLGEDCDDQSKPASIPTLQSEKCIDMSSGNVVSFAVTDEGSVYSWGMGTNYQLGHGDEEDCHVPKVIEGNLLNSWHAFKVSGGGQHTLILANRKATTEKKSGAKK